MLGLQEVGAICLILTQAFMYVIPALVMSFGSCIAILTYASIYLEKDFNVTVERYPSFESCI
jgi:hypothetical protein